MPIARTALGLLARHEAGHATFPFVVGDWVPAAGLSLSLASGKLRHTHSSTGVMRWVLYSNVASRAKSMIQYQVRGPIGYAQGGANAHIQDVALGSEDGVHSTATLGRVAGELLIVGETIAGVRSDTSSGVALKSAAIDHRFSFFTDGLNLALRDFTEGINLAHVATTHGAGQVGLSSLSVKLTDFTDFASFFAMADRYVVVSGLPTGATVEVQEADGTLIASAAEAGGAASVDLFAALFPEPALVVVKDSGGAVLDTETPTELVWGGDTYEYTEPEPEDVWAACDDAEAASWEECETPGETLSNESFAFLDLDDAEGSVAEDSSGNDRDGTYGAGVIEYQVPGPEGETGVETSGVADGLQYGGVLDFGTGLFEDPDYEAPTIHTGFTISFLARPTELQAVPVKMSDPVGTGHIVDSISPNRFLTMPVHGQRDTGASDDFHAGVGVALGTNCILVCEHSSNHVPARAVYEDDLSDYHRYHVTFGPSPEDVAGVKIFVDGVHALDLAGTYRQGPSTYERPFLMGPLLTVADPASWITGFIGWIGDFIIWDRVLTSEEILGHYEELGIDPWEELDPIGTVWEEV